MLNDPHIRVKRVGRILLFDDDVVSLSNLQRQVIHGMDDIADSKADVTIKSASINTGNDDRDGHVKGDDFFAVEKYPELTFTATSFNVDEAGNGTVTGDLTIKGVTKPVTLDVETEGLAEDPFGNTRFGFEATTKINRLDYGIDFNAPLKTGGVLVSEEIKIELEVSAIKQ